MIDATGNALIPGDTVMVACGISFSLIPGIFIREVNGNGLVKFLNYRTERFLQYIDDETRSRWYATPGRGYCYRPDNILRVDRVLLNNMSARKLDRLESYLREKRYL